MIIIASPFSSHLVLELFSLYFFIVDIFCPPLFDLLGWAGRSLCHFSRSHSDMDISCRFIPSDSSISMVWSFSSLPPNAPAAVGSILYRFLENLVPIFALVREGTVFCLSNKAPPTLIVQTCISLPNSVSGRGLWTALTSKTLSTILNKHWRKKLYL